MKGKHLALLLLVALLVGGAWYSLQQGDKAAGRQSDGSGTKVLDFSINDAAHVTVKGAGAELNLVRKGDEWTVQERADYPAPYEQVSDLIRKLWNLKTVQDVKVGPSQFSRLELIEPGKDGGSAGTLAEVKDKDGKPLAALLLGKKYFKKGEGTQFIGDNIKRFKAGDVVLVGANLPHYWRFDDCYFQESTRAHADVRVAHFCEDFWGAQFLQLPENLNLKCVLEKSKRGIQVTGKTKQKVAELLEELLYKIRLCISF